MAARTPMMLHGIPGWVINLYKPHSDIAGLCLDQSGESGRWPAVYLADLNERAEFRCDPLDTMLTHWPMLLAVLAGGWLVFGLSTTLGRLTSMKKPLRRIRKKYLSSVIVQREKLEIEGIPALLLYELVDLEAIFIPSVLNLTRCRWTRS